MDINEYTLNKEFDTPDAGRIFFRGQFYTPTEIQAFADELTALADLAESYLPEEESREYKENQAYYARLNYDTFKNLLFTTPISQYVKVWEDDVAAGRDLLGSGEWREHDGDRLVQVKKFIKEYEAEHNLPK